MNWPRREGRVDGEGVCFAGGGLVKRIALGNAYFLYVHVRTRNDLDVPKTRKKAYQFLNGIQQRARIHAHTYATHAHTYHWPGINYYGARLSYWSEIVDKPGLRSKKEPRVKYWYRNKSTIFFSFYYYYYTYYFGKKYKELGFFFWFFIFFNVFILYIYLLYLVYY